MRIWRFAALVAALVAVQAAPGWARDKRVVQLFTDMQKEIVEISDGVKKSVVHV